MKIWECHYASIVLVCVLGRLVFLRDTIFLGETTGRSMAGLVERSPRVRCGRRVPSMMRRTQMSRPRWNPTTQVYF